MVWMDFWKPSRALLCRKTGLPIQAPADLVALDFFTGPFDVLAEAFSRVAARGDEGQERGDE
jgi:hypothetical protein